MKKVFLFLAVASLGFVSCKDDDNVTSSSPLHGKWEVQSYDAEATVNGDPIPDEDIDLDNVVGTIFEFKSDGKLLVTSYDDFDEKWTTDEGTYVYFPNQNKINYTMIDSIDGTSYTETMDVKLLNTTNFDFNTTIEEVDGNEVYKLSMDIFCVKKN